MTKEEYEAKREARYDRLLAAAARAEAESGRLIDQSHRMADVIPFGQPILVGHSSEGRDRRYRARIENKFRRGYDLHEKAGRLRERAEAAKRNNTIFSDDPSAVERLEEKIARLEKRQELMKAANKLARKGDRDGLAALGFSDQVIDKLLAPDWAGHPGFPSYETTNNGANIRRLKERVVEVKSHADDKTTEQRIGDIRIVDDTDDSRLQIFFPGKPPEAVRADLKSHGFRWSPTNGCWQAFRGNNANYWAKAIIDKHYPAPQA